MSRFVVVALAVLVAGCSLEPTYLRPSPAIPGQFPMSQAAAPLDRQIIFTDARLQRLIARALANNQNLRAAVANVEAARGLYRVQRAALLPSIDGGASATVRKSSSANGGAGTNSGGSFVVDACVQFELDLFGRIRSLTDAQLDSYLATDAAARAVRVTLTADVADAWLTLANDRTLLAIARNTQQSASKSVALTQARLRGGVAPRTDLRQAQTVLATADSDVASLTTVIAQDRNAIDLLIGETAADADLAAMIDTAGASVSSFGAGLDSGVLLRRPDVVAAEYRLRASSARIGAARAAFFPRLSLTGLAGFASSALTGLFSSNAFTASVTPSVSLPIFDGGASRGNLLNARANRDAAVAAYRFTIQTAFRETADALARSATIADQAAAVARLEAAARDSAFLADARYRGGVDTFLASLDAQRTLYAARRTLAATQLTRARNVVALYRALGGDEGLDPQPR